MGGGGGALFGKADLDAPVGEVANAGGGGEMGGMAAAFGGGGAQMVKMLPMMFGKGSDRGARQDVARLYTLMEIGRFTGLRAQAAAARGQRPGPEVSTGKLLASQIVRLMRDAGLRMAGAKGMLAGTDAPLGGMLQMLALFSPAVSIAGGTDEVQRNIIGERVLLLPKEPQVDRDIPFNEIPKGK
jgi:hypothetical protein